MTDEQIIEEMAKAMAASVKDVEWRHYVKPATAAFHVAQERILQARAST
jgi:hypothetical protein